MSYSSFKSYDEIKNKNVLLCIIYTIILYIRNDTTAFIELDSHFGYLKYSKNIVTLY